MTCANMSMLRGLSRSPICGETHRAPLPSQRNGILHMSADGKDRFGQSFGQIDFQWRDPAPEPDRARLAADDAHDGIVGGADDRSVVMQKRIGYRSETCLRFCVIGQHRLAADIARCRDQGPAECVQHKSVQRTVR